LIFPGYDAGAGAGLADVDVTGAALVGFELASSVPEALAAIASESPGAPLFAGQPIAAAHRNAKVALEEAPRKSMLASLTKADVKPVFRDTRC